MLVDEEPLDSFGPLERFQMQAIGIEKGKPFNPDAKTKALLVGGGAPWRRDGAANTYASASPGVFYYPDRKWQHVPDGMTYTFTRDGAPQIDARDNVYYMAAGNSPAMMEKCQKRTSKKDVDSGPRQFRTSVEPDTVLKSSCRVSDFAFLAAWKEQSCADKLALY